MDFLRSEEELSRVLSLQRVMTSAGALAGDLRFEVRVSGVGCELKLGFRV